MQSLTPPVGKHRPFVARRNNGGVQWHGTMRLIVFAVIDVTTAPRTGKTTIFHAQALILPYKENMLTFSQKRALQQ